MFEESFEKLEEDEVASILKELNPFFGGSEFKADRTTILAVSPSFYPKYRFLDICDNTLTPSMQRYVLYKKGESKIIDYTNKPIYELNQTLPIKLNKKNVAEYVRFFFTYVRGRQGRFCVAENVDDIPWKENPPPSARRAITGIISPITCEKKDKDGNFHLKACMVFKDCLFQSSVIVSKDGFMQLRDEELLIDEMPLLDDTFFQ